MEPKDVCVANCAQFTRKETKGKQTAGEAFTHKGYRWVITHVTPNVVYAKPVGN